MAHTIYMVEVTLSDGSIVYDVTIGGMNFPCVTENDALAFATSFDALVKDHTNEELNIVETSRVA